MATVLTIGALAFAHPSLLLAPGAIVAYLLATQVSFTYAIGRLDESLQIKQTFDRHATLTGEPVTATLVAAGNDAGLNVSVTARPSAGLDVGGESNTELGSTTSFTLRSDIAGTHRLRPPKLDVSDPTGLFTEVFTRGAEREVIVEARRPRDIHIGEGGRRLQDAFGEHTLETSGAGLTPAELRQYIAGEPAANIDWKATARLGTPYVREFEADSDQTTLIVVDARSNLQAGPPGGTAFEYLRTVALSRIAISQRIGDPIGCFGIDDSGIRQLVAPTNAARGYELARRRLRGLTVSTGRPHPRRSPPIHRRLDSDEDGTRFGEVIQTYARARPATNPESNPLQAAVRTAIMTHTGALRIVLFTDDSDRADLRAAIREVRHGDHELDVFLAPTVLFEPGMLSDRSAATERYRDFEKFRRQLIEVDGVNAYEVAPRSRIETVLEQERIGDETRPAR